MIIGCRSAGSGECALKEIHRSDPASIITFREGLELTDLDAVYHWSDKIKRELQRDNEKLDLLVCNAGIMHHPFELTKDGLETHMQGTTRISKSKTINLIIRSMGRKRPKMAPRG